jgi:hypothetical protein
VKYLPNGTNAGYMGSVGPLPLDGANSRKWEIDNNFGYEKITQLVDNIPLSLSKCWTIETSFLR